MKKLISVACLGCIFLVGMKVFGMDEKNKLSSSSGGSARNSPALSRVIAMHNDSKLDSNREWPRNYNKFNKPRNRKPNLSNNMPSTPPGNNL